MKIDKTTEEIKRRLVDIYKPQEILLFGSYAWGKPDNGSDLDIIVIVESSNERITARAIPGHRALVGIPLPVDLLVVTRQEYISYLNSGELFWQKIRNKGVKLYDAA